MNATHVDEPGQLALDFYAPKICRDCDEVKPSTDYHRDRSRPDGLAFYCKPCTRARNNARAAANPELARARVRQWVKDNPERKRAADAKYRSENKDRLVDQQARWKQENRERHLQSMRDWRAKNLARHAAGVLRWQAKNPAKVRAMKVRWQRANRDVMRFHAQNRRARQRATTTVPFTPAQLAQRWAYYGDRCWVCGVHADSTDHVKPIAKGGAHMLCNLRPICRMCNAIKGAKWPYPPPRLKPSASNRSV